MKTSSHRRLFFRRLGALSAWALALAAQQAVVSDAAAQSSASFSAVSISGSLRVNTITSLDSSHSALLDLGQRRLYADDESHTLVLDWSFDYAPGLIIDVPVSANGVAAQVIITDTLSVSSSVFFPALSHTVSYGIVGINTDGQLVRLPYYISGSYLGLGSQSSPGYPLDVGGNANVSGTLFSGTVSADSVMGDILHAGPPAYDGWLLNLTSATNSSNSATTYSRSFGSTLNAYLANGVQYLDLIASGNGTDAGVIRFLTVSTSSTSGPTERGRFDGNGNLGLGTSTPASRLSVNGGVSIGSYAGSTPAPTNGLIVSSYVGVGTASPASPFSVNGGVGIGSYASGSAAPTNGLIVSGKVGIGTASPTTLSSNLLDVNGGATVRGVLRLRAGGDLSMGTFTSSNGHGAP